MPTRTGTRATERGLAAQPGARDVAARIVTLVLTGRVSIDKLLEEHLELPEDNRDRAFLKELVYGVMRWYFRLDFIVGRLLKHPMKRRDLDVRSLLLCGLHQIFNMRVAPHAAVSESVQCAHRLQKPWAGAVVNAVLRRALREHAELLAAVEQDAVARYSHPEWLIAAMQEDWPDEWRAILDANNERAPLDLRVNQARCTTPEYQELLHAQGMAAEPVSGADSALRLHAPVEVGVLPGFAQGLVSVQDAGAQLAAPMLEVRAGQRILDACAAPGGKSCHILEQTRGQVQLVALDRDRDQLRKLNDNLSREGLAATVLEADATQPEQWWDGKHFDRVLVDAPCTATGVIRRHPDVKVVRRPAQLQAAIATQRQLLNGLWALLAPGGRLLYSTCSLLRAENDAQIENFLGKHKDAAVIPLLAEKGSATLYGRQTLPGRDDTDGFYYAFLEKR